MSFKENFMDKKSLQEKVEERVLFFMKFQPQNCMKKNLNRFPNYNGYSTLIDPLNIQNDKILVDRDFNYAQKIKKNILNSNINENLNLNKEKLNDSTLSTQTITNIEVPIKKVLSIQVSKDLAKYTEPRFERKKFLKLAPKFIYDENDLINNNIEYNDNNKLSKHNYTNSELEILETDEKVPQNTIEKLTNNISKNKINNIIINNNNLLFLPHYLNNQEKCYQELIKDLKENGLNNIEYKLKIACSYINIITEEKNILPDIFYIHEDDKDINTFLNRELCLFLTILFLDDFSSGLNNNHIKEFLTCYNYCYTNLLYVIMLVIKKVEEFLSENKIMLNDNSNELNNLQKCKQIIEFNNDKINIKKYKDNFHTNNKIIKNILLNLLNIFRDINNDITDNISEIFNLSKYTKFKYIINEHLRNNSLIIDKIRDSINKYHLPEKIDDESIDIENDNNGYNENIINQNILKPFLPPKKKGDNREYCLVLDLDETLVHFFEDNNEAYVKVRMGAEHFITILSQYCEIVIFTASTKYYADIVIDGLDCKNLIDYKLYREHTYDFNGANVKDLSKLGRDLNKTIIIDNIEENYCFQPNNGLNIIDFEGDENDNELQFLLEDLLEIVTVPGKNVIYELQHIRNNMKKRYIMQTFIENN